MTRSTVAVCVVEETDLRVDDPPVVFSSTIRLVASNTAKQHLIQIPIPCCGSSKVSQPIEA